MTSPETKKKPKSKPAAKKPKATTAKAKPKAASKRRSKKSTEPGPEKAPKPQKVIIASQNPAKIKAVEIGFGRMFPEVEFIFEGASVISGVGLQPMSDDQTFAGALQRAYTAREQIEDAAFYVGMEGGVEEMEDELYAFAWVVVLGPDKLVGKSRTATFVLPPAVSELVREGKELGEADDIVFGTEESKATTGAVGILTHGLFDRAQYYSESVIMGLIPFKNHQLFLQEQEEEV